MPKSEVLKNAEALFSLMSELLEKLIENAKKLREVSSHPIAEDIFDALQKKQQDMMRELVELDERAKKHNLTASDTLKKKVEAQLNEFQKINLDYVEHLRRKLSLIQFSSPMKEGGNSLESSE